MKATLRWSICLSLVLGSAAFAQQTSSRIPRTPFPRSGQHTLPMECKPVLSGSLSTPAGDQRNSSIRENARCRPDIVTSKLVIAMGGGYLRSPAPILTTKENAYGHKRCRQFQYDTGAPDCSLSRPV
jgi:hypothetical protein